MCLPSSPSNECGKITSGVECWICRLLLSRKEVQLLWTSHYQYLGRVISCCKLVAGSSQYSEQATMGQLPKYELSGWRAWSTWVSLGAVSQTAGNAIDVWTICTERSRSRLPFITSKIPLRLFRTYMAYYQFNHKFMHAIYSLALLGM